MPRRVKDDAMSDSVDASAALAAQQAGAETPEPNGETAPAVKPPKADLPLGPMVTRTGAEALVIKAPKGQRVFTAGGDKGGKIAELLRSRPDMSRKDIAAVVGCSQSRVAEVARVLGLSQGRPTPAPAPEGQDVPASASA